MGGGGGGTPGPTYEEQLLAQMADQKYDIAKQISEGTDYLTKDAAVDRTARYTEAALGDTARLLGANQVEVPESPVTGPVDLSANVAALNAGKTQADLDSQAKVNGVAQNSIGNMADTTAALHQEGARKQAIAQAEQDYKNASQGAVVNAITSAGTAYAMNHKKINAGVKDAYASAKKTISAYKPWAGR